MTYTN